MVILRHIRIKFIWGASDKIVADWKMGLWGFYERIHGYPNSGLAISVRGCLLCFGVILPLLAYLSATSAIFLWLDRKEHNHVTYRDALLLPIRWDEVQRKRGQAYLDEGMADLQQKRWGEGMMKLRSGLARVPQALEPRVTMAQIYRLSQRYDLASEMLLGGLDAVTGYPGRDYVLSYLRLALQGEDYESMIAVLDRYLSASIQLPPEEKEWLEKQKLMAMLAMGHPEEALPILEAAPENDTYREERVLIMIDRGELDRAREFLHEWSMENGETEGILRLLARVSREAKDVDAMNQYFASLRRLQPSNPRLLSTIVVEQYLVGAEDDARASLDDYFFRFGGFEENLKILFISLANVGAESLLRDCLRHAEEQGYEQSLLLFRLAEVQLIVEDWAGAWETIQRLEQMPIPDEMEDGFSRRVATLSLLARVGVNPAKGLQVQFQQTIEASPYSFKEYRRFAETLLRMKRYHAALEMIALAESKYPKNHGLDSSKEKAMLANAAIEAEQGVALTSPETFLLPENEFFERLDALRDLQAWPDARALIRKVQQAEPDWLSKRNTEVYLTQIQIAREMDESLEMILAIRMMLNGGAENSQRLVDYALLVKEQGDDELAIQLMFEISKKPYHSDLARQYYEEWSESRADGY